MKKRKYPTLVVSGYAMECKLENTYKFSVNIHKGAKWWYWFIEPNEKPVKLPCGEVPAQLKEEVLKFSPERRLKKTVLGTYR